VSDFDDVRDAAEAAAVIGKLDVAAELVDRYRMGVLGSLWCDAEGIPTGWDQLSDEAQQMIEDRIRRQETQTPGDLVVRAVQVRRELQRTDDVVPWLMRRFLETELARQKGTSIKRLHRYDSFEFGEGGRSFTHIRLFGNANVGWQDRTNLQVAGQFFMEGCGFLTKMYLTIVPPVGTLVTLHGVVNLTVGDRRVCTGLAHQLLVRPQPIDVALPARQNVWAEYDVGTATRGSGAPPPQPPDGTRVYVHVEGYHIDADY
jgi:hypothetical protein